MPGCPATSRVICPSLWPRQIMSADGTWMCMDDTGMNFTVPTRCESYNPVTAALDAARRFAGRGIAPAPRAPSATPEEVKYDYAKTITIGSLVALGVIGLGAFAYWRLKK